MMEIDRYLYYFFLTSLYYAFRAAIYKICKVNFDQYTIIHFYFQTLFL